MNSRSRFRRVLLDGFCCEDKKRNLLDGFIRFDLLVVTGFDGGGAGLGAGARDAGGARILEVLPGPAALPPLPNGL